MEDGTLTKLQKQLQNSNPVEKNLLNKVHDVVQKIYRYTTDQSLEAIQQCQAKITYVNQSLQVINDEKIQKHLRVKHIYKSISKTNLQIMKDANDNLWRQCELIKANLLHFESEFEQEKPYDLSSQIAKSSESPEKAKEVVPNLNRLSSVTNNEITEKFETNDDLYDQMSQHEEEEKQNDQLQEDNPYLKEEDNINNDKAGTIAKDNIANGFTQFFSNISLKAIQQKYFQDTFLGIQTGQDGQVTQESAQVAQETVEDEFIQRMLKAYEDKAFDDPQLMEQLSTFKKQINRHASTLVLICLLKLFDLLSISLKAALDRKSKLPGVLIKKIYIQCSKLYLGDYLLHIAMITPIDDIFYQEVNSEDWAILLSSYSYYEFASNHKVVQNYRHFYNYVALGNAMLSKTTDKDNILAKTIKQGFFGALYFLSKKKRMERSDYINANPDLKFAIELWNMLENKVVSHALEIIIPSIKINRKIYIPMVDTILTRDNIDNLPQFEAHKFHHKGKGYLNKLLQHERLKLAADDDNHELDQYHVEPVFHTKKDEYNPNTHVMVRILSSQEIPVDFETGYVHQGIERCTDEPSTFFQKIFQPYSENITKKVKFNTLIIHAHGGGFVAMSSGSHQNYTRVWANETNVPIISIDYRLAPQEQFPAALNDVWQTYYWLVEYSQAFLGIQPDKIILVGDSAGGNLMAAITIMAIERNYRVPDGLILCYPALSLSKNRFTPSLLLAIDDPILPYSFLKMCLSSYVGDYSNCPQCDPDTQRYLSPGYASDEVLKKFPKTRIMVAANDPLRDETLKFTLRLARLGVDVYLKEYSYMPHGYLNYNAPLFGMKNESNEGISQGTRWLQDFILNSPEDLLL